MGGIVAFEMAQQLYAQGQQVAMLALLDTRLPHAGNPKARRVLNQLFSRWRDRLRRRTSATEDETRMLVSFAQDLGLSSEQVSVLREQLIHADPAERLAYLLERAQELGALPDDTRLGALQQLFTIFKNNVQALQSYVPKPYSGRTFLFTAEESSTGNHRGAKIGWDDLVENLEIHSLPGNHYTMVSEPHVGVLAQRLRSVVASGRRVKE